DGSMLDLHADRSASAAAIADFAGAKAAGQYQRFAERAARLFDAFHGPMMETAKPSVLQLTRRVITQPGLLGAMAPLATMAQDLQRSFDDPRLRQLFGRYATYVGGSPYAAPALLSLISHSEALGVWSVKGGMHALAQGLETLGTSLGVTYRYGQPVQRFDVTKGRVTTAHTPDGRVTGDAFVFNGDPVALHQGLVGDAVTHAVAPDATEPRSLSAWVYGFDATPKGADLTHHNVFFGADPEDEFAPLAQGQMPTDPTLYICAQDRGAGAMPTGPERFEIIMNGAPTHQTRPSPEDETQCQTRVFGTLAQFGLTFSPEPGAKALTTPAGFNALFPGSRGSLYGRSPHGMTAALKRPTARTKIKGLYLVGGGAHPGAGVPMAALSALHVAGAIGKDLSLT
ncbi:MAG: methoxyneurosporene dehydrogenase, partial [Pseudomonadota bacterium]